MADETCIIYYHGNDWDGVPARQRYLMQALSGYVQIFYLDQGRDRKGAVTLHRVSERITVIRGLIRMFLFFQDKRVSFLKGLYARWCLRSIRRKYRTIIFWSAENWMQPFRSVPHDLMVFDAIDPCFDTTPAVLRAFNEREDALLEDADFVFASADVLAERCGQRHQRVTLVNNACEPSEYRTELLMAASKPGWWPDTPSPVAAYLGSLDWRLDIEAMMAACRANPRVHFILAGKIVTRDLKGLSALLALPNVTAPGQISVEDGRYLLSRCRAGLIPFLPGEMNDGVNPVKMYAYALLGKPILGTDVRELRDRPELVVVARDAGEFAAKVPLVMEMAADEASSERRRNFALANTWTHRARQVWNVLSPTMESAGHACPPPKENRLPANTVF